MKEKLPIRNLMLLNWLLALVIGGFAMIFMLLDERDGLSLYCLSAMSAVIVMIDGSVNLQILKKMNSKVHHRASDLRYGLYLLSYLISSINYLLCWAVFSTLAGLKWLYTDMRVLAIFLLVSGLLNTLILLLQRFLVLQHEMSRADHELSQIKIAHAEAANLLLKQQIHPHFLFNSLSNVKALYNDDSATGERYLVHLANFLRASVSFNDKKKSLLKEEMAILEDYLQMQQIRFEDALQCTIEIPEDSFGRFYLPSFSLQPLIENAIKHNDLTEEMPLCISIVQLGDRIRVSNNLQPKSQPEPSTGKGLANLSDRYRLLSQEDILISQQQNTFSVSLKLLPV